MGESQSTKATIPLKVMKNLSALSPHHNRAALHSLLSHAWGYLPLASPFLCQPPEEPSRLTRLKQLCRSPKPRPWLLGSFEECSMLAQCFQPTTQKLQQSGWKTSNDNDPIWSWTHNTFLNTAMHLSFFNFLSITPQQTVSAISPIIQKR